MPTQPTPPPSVEFLFLASHGLLSPISAIRWGCNRLQRTDTKKLSKEQKDLLEHIYANARVLSKLFGSMLLLARNEDQTYEVHTEPVALFPLLQSEAREWEEQEEGKVVLDGDASLSITTDSAILEAVLQNIFAVCSEAMQTPKSIRIECQGDGDEVLVVCTGKMELPFLNQVQTLENLSESRPIVGGTPGLLLSLSQALIGFVGGSLSMHEGEKGEYVMTLKLPRE